MVCGPGVGTPGPQSLPSHLGACCNGLPDDAASVNRARSLNLYSHLLMFEDFVRPLRDLQRRAEELDGEHQFSFPELFPDEFMLRNTEFPTIDALFAASGFKVESSEDLAAIPDAPWDAFVASRTRFASWDEMKNAAAGEWARRRLGLD